MHAPTGLLCDLLAWPELGTIRTPAPTFGWILNSPSKPAAQRACQVRVATTLEKLSQAETCVWDSGRLDRSESLHLPYQGEVLHAGETYSWKVRVWDHEGNASPWSAPQSFTLDHWVEPNATSRYRVQRHRHFPERLLAHRERHHFADFGRHAFGWLELTLESPDDDSVIEVRLGEKAHGDAVDLHPGGTIRSAQVSLALRRGRHTYRVATPPDLRNTSGDAVLLPPEFGIVMPFRYVELIGHPVPPQRDDIVQIRLEYPFDEAASAFTSSAPALDEVWSFCKYSIRATTFCGVYIDGDRERIPYEADAYLNQLGHYAVDREFSLGRHSHEYLLTHPTSPTEWKQFSVMTGWADYEATGDARSLARHYDVLVREKIYLDRARPDGLIDTHDLRDIVDWPAGERDDYDFQPVNTVVNAFHAHTLNLMARIAGALGKRADAEQFTESARQVTASFHRVFFNPATGRYRDGDGSAHESFHANLFPLAFGLVPDKARARVVDFVKSRGMACSVYAAQFLIEGLFLSGEADHAIGLMTSTEERSWHNMLRQGATITWEAWDDRFKPNQDWNHPWGAAPANLIPRFVLGVRPLEPGFGRVLIAPQPGPLTEIHGVVPTIRGPIRVDARRHADRTWTVDYEVPVGVTADVVIPTT